MATIIGNRTAEFDCAMSVIFDDDAYGPHLEFNNKNTVLHVSLTRVEIEHVLAWGAAVLKTEHK